MKSLNAEKWRTPRNAEKKIKNFLGETLCSLRLYVIPKLARLVLACLLLPSIFNVQAEDVSTETNAPTLRVLTETDALKLLTDTLQKKYVKSKGELELTFTQPWVEATVTNAPLTVKILELPTVGVTPSFIIRFQLGTTNGTVGTWQASLQAHIWRDVWVARSDLARGTLISEADVARDRRDVLGIGESLADFASDDNSLQLANTISSGNIIYARNLKPRAVLHRGQIADAVLSDGALNIMMKVEVLEDGAPGQIVRIRNPVSLRNFSGKVINDQTIAITL
jgi:flagella basal body P-ring formation protein FlgA